VPISSFISVSASTLMEEGAFTRSPREPSLPSSLAGLIHVFLHRSSLSAGVLQQPRQKLRIVNHLYSVFASGGADPPMSDDIRPDW
jgi:hypothetical protein